LIPITTSPSSAADIIGFSVRLARDNARLLMRILLWPTLIELLGKILTLMGINAYLVNAGHGNWFAVAGGVVLCLIGGAIALGAQFFLTLRQLALFRMYAGFDENFKDAYRYVLGKKFQLLAALFATYLLSTTFFFAWVIEVFVSTLLMANKALAIFGFAAACWGIILIFFSMVWSLLPLVMIAPALSIEQRPFTQLIGRGVKLSLNHLIRATYFLFLLGVVLICLSYVLNIPPAIAQAIELSTTYFTEHAFARVPNLALQIFASAWRSAASMLLSPMAFFACGFFYLDLRMRTEGFDIARRLELLSSRLAIRP